MEIIPEKYQEVDGDLIALALEGQFDVITHGCNSWNNMNAGIAPQMARAFHCDNFKLEREFEIHYTSDGEEVETETNTRGDINKLGQIDYGIKGIKNGKVYSAWDTRSTDIKPLIIVNSYTQYGVGKINKSLDYEALTLCLRKINHRFKGKHIGLPYVIGCGLAGGDIDIVIPIIKKELSDMFVTMVRWKK